MGTSVASVQRVCALDSCTNPVEPVPSGEPRRYCRPEHRKMARRQRRDQAEEARGGPAEDAQHDHAEEELGSPAGDRLGGPAVEQLAGDRLGGQTGETQGGPAGEERGGPAWTHGHQPASDRLPAQHQLPSGQQMPPGQQVRSGHPVPLGHEVPLGRQVPLGRPPVTAAPYRRLVPEPKPRWFRRPRPYAARRVRPLRQRDVAPPPPAQTDWSRPAPAPAQAPVNTSAPPPAPSTAGAPAQLPVSASPPAPAPVTARPPAHIPTTARPPVPIPATARPPAQVPVTAGPPVHPTGPRAARRGTERAARRAARREVRRAERREAAALLAGTGTPPPAVAAGRRAAKALAAEWLPQMREALLAALHSLSNNRLRALLTTTGIVVGVAAVIVLVALGDGMKANFDAQFSKLANQAIITTAKGSVPDGREPRKLTDQDVEALTDPRRAPHIAAVSPAIQGNVTVTAGQAKDNASLVGATENYLEMQNRRIATGSWFTSEQISGGERRVVLGQQAVHLLWGPGVAPDQLIGRPIRLSHSTFKIQGVLAADGQNDNSVIVPLAAARAYLVGNKGGEVSQITLRSTSVADLDEAVLDATRILDAQHYIREPTGRDFNVTTFTELLNQSTQFLDFLAMFIVAIAAISLFVGGVGVANIMLVSVTERTREIGIRKAVGAKTTAILRQFLSEAVILTGLGGAVGAVLGVTITETGAAVLPDLVPQVPVPILSMGSVVTAFAVSLVIGLLAGGYPAHRAARLRPIEALRFE